MAEKKTKKTEENSKPTYEQLEMAVNNLMWQLGDKQKMEQLNEITARLNFLFKVVEFADKFPESYVAECVSDIVRILPAGVKAEEDAE